MENYGHNMWSTSRYIELQSWNNRGLPNMVAKFKVGDHVTSNSEAGHVSGKIIKVHIRDADYKDTRITRARMIRNMKSSATRPITSRCIRVPR